MTMIITIIFILPPPHATPEIIHSPFFSLLPEHSKSASLPLFVNIESFSGPLPSPLQKGGEDAITILVKSHKSLHQNSLKKISDGILYL